MPRQYQPRENRLSVNLRKNQSQIRTDYSFCGSEYWFHNTWSSTPCWVHPPVDSTQSKNRFCGTEKRQHVTQNLILICGQANSKLKSSPSVDWLWLFVGPLFPPWATFDTTMKNRSPVKLRCSHLKATSRPYNRFNYFNTRKNILRFLLK